MKQDFLIKQAAFQTSAGAEGDYPPALPSGVEIAIVGKSNVGKSSLINSLCNNYKLARTSSSPGKTRLINFFIINRSFYLVDLPGYGFAKASKGEKASWGGMMERYLATGRLKHIIMLLDIRHEPTEEDKQMFSYLLYYNIPFTMVATKADKIARSKRKQAADKAAKLLGAPPAAIPYSAETGEGKPELLSCIGGILEDSDMREAGKEDILLRNEGNLQE